MRLFWWQQLPLLIIIQLIEPSRISHTVYAEASFDFKSKFESSKQTVSVAGRNPCLRQWACLNCYRIKDPSLSSMFPGIYTLSLQAETFKFSPFTPKFNPLHSSIQLQEKVYRTRDNKIVVKASEGSDVPTLTPEQEVHDKKPNKRKLAAISGGVVAAILVVIIVLIVYMCLVRVKRFVRRSSETASSIPSPPDELERGNTSPFAIALSPFDTQRLRQLSILELEEATSNFSQHNIIGEGRFGLTYKGLLRDGSIVTIKRRLHAPTQYFFHEVKHISRVQHTHLVKLIGCYQDSHQQILVYDYLLFGNVGNHLYDSEGLPSGKLGIRRRLSIALAAAKGLRHLHSLVPPFFHMHFRTSNVLVDEHYVAKVSDYGLTRLLIEGNHAGSSSSFDCFLDPELDMLKNFSDRSDVYSFGVFLLELISGREAHGRNLSNSEENLVLQAKACKEFEEFVDKSFEGEAINVAKQMMELALTCLNSSTRRPPMRFVVQELEQIEERVIGHFHSELDVQIGDVTLGSELFK